MCDFKVISTIFENLCNVDRGIYKCKYTYIFMFIYISIYIYVYLKTQCFKM